MRGFGAMAGGVLAVWASAAMAASGPSSFEVRVDAWASYSVAGPTCIGLGYEFHRDRFGQVSPAMVAEGLKAGASEDRLTALLEAGNAKYVAELKGQVAALKDARSKASDDPTLGPALKIQLAAFVARYDRRCAAAAADSVYKPIVDVPAPAVLAAARQDYMDDFLAPAGLASYQPPEALTRGDLVMATGVCKGLLSDTELKPYQGGVLDGPEPTDPAKAKLREWYAGQYEEGVKSVGELDKEQCARVLPRLLAKVPTK